MSKKWLLIEHNKCFINWVNERVSKDNSSSKTIKWISYMSKFNIITWSAYDISKCLFYTKSKDDRSTMQNSEVMVEAEFMY